MFKLIKFLFVLFLGVISCACVNMVAVHELNTKASDFLRDGDVNAAISRLEASIDLDWKIYESRYNLASAYLLVGKAEKALEQIEVAITLNKTEPIVFYTHAVAALRVADELYVKKDESGKKVYTKFSSKEAELKAAKRYVELLDACNRSFEKYMDLAPNAEDTQKIFELINENKEKIAQKVEEFDIQYTE